MGERGGASGMTGTSGVAGGTSSLAPRYEALTLLAIVGLSLVNNVVNVSTILTDRANNGLATTEWKVWLDELSSWVGLACMLPLVRRSARALRPPLLPWAAAPLAHLPVAMIFSAGHVAIMIAIRQLGWASAGLQYEFFGDSPAGTLIYEFRKDILFYTSATIFLLLARALAESRSVPAAVEEPVRIEVRDRSRTVWLAANDILSVEAAANYVELRTREGALLHRATLSAMEAQLGAGFVRIHRSRLVRRDAVRELRTLPSGDFELVLSDGRTLAGSRRYRDRLAAA
jgi:DNA-binding LytR/AlgR family response regulator